MKIYIPHLYTWHQIEECYPTLLYTFCRLKVHMYTAMQLTLLKHILWARNKTNLNLTQHSPSYLIMTSYLALTRSLQWRHAPRCSINGIIVEFVSCLVHGLHDFHGIWCVFHSVPQGRRLRARRALSTLLTPFAWLRSCSVFTAVWCCISFVKTHLSSPDPIMWLWLVWTNSPNFTHQGMNQLAQWSK